jgi:hypothetical protein
MYYSAGLITRQTQPRIGKPRKRHSYTLGQHPYPTYIMSGALGIANNLLFTGSNSGSSALGRAFDLATEINDRGIPEQPFLDATEAALREISPGGDALDGIRNALTTGGDVAESEYVSTLDSTAACPASHNGSHGVCACSLVDVILRYAAAKRIANGLETKVDDNDGRVTQDEHEQFHTLIETAKSGLSDVLHACVIVSEVQRGKSISKLFEGSSFPPPPEDIDTL